MEEQEIEIFKLENADAVEAHRKNNMNIDAMRRDLKNKMNSFLRGAFTNKTEEVLEDAKYLTDHSKSVYPELCEQEGDFKNLYEKTTAILTTIPTLTTGFTESVKGLVEKSGQASEQGDFESVGPACGPGGQSMLGPKMIPEFLVDLWTPLVCRAAGVRQPTYG